VGGLRTKKTEAKSDLPFPFTKDASRKHWKNRAGIEKKKKRENRGEGVGKRKSGRERRGAAEGKGNTTKANAQNRQPMII